MIAVVMEEDCKQSVYWPGTVGGHLGSMKYQPCWDDNEFDNNMESLCSTIMQMIKTPIRQKLNPLQVFSLKQQVVLLTMERLEATLSHLQLQLKM